MSVQFRNNVHCHGDGPATIMFVHGYGCDQQMWRFIYPSFLGRYRVVLMDLTGSGGSDLGAYDREKYSTLHGHAEDVLDVIGLYAKAPVVFVGHSVAAMIGMLASIMAPEKFVAQIMVGPSPSFINDGDYVGGFNAEDIDGLLQMMEIDYDSWIKRMAPVIMGAPRQPVLQQELLTRFQKNDPEISRHFARVTFTADHRADVEKSTVPALILQCSDDMIAPREVGDWLHQHLPHSELAVITNIGHCPHLSSPSASSDIINDYLLQIQA
ncbi:alpha/beta fold hydrolase [Pseudoduganella sp. FT25W]|jgi:sigma-B regulation protein RsbQ|uniref:Alpha/beta fold hydrolase n=1 Tax=Duganella alba TaxID=2666081 RepID=A0A6L5Q9M9_9BURK|nr:alpha/beta hydrolase [Duganella alba]MRX06356.1 alpha/beta fold hydrolase [Duganella alba]MRX14750.1 alpha/beta fold hydrolase [Duganella alba]